MTTVYGIQFSPFVRKVILALEAKGIEFTVNPVTPLEKPAGFEALSPLGKIPAFEDDKIKLADSSVICEYLDQRYPENPLYPEDLVTRAKARWYEEYADTAVISVAGPIFFERVVKKILMKQEADEERVSNAIENDMPKVFSYLEGQLGESDFLVSNNLTTADLCMGSMLLNMKYGGVDVDSVHWPKLAAYRDRLFATTLFANRIAADQAMMSA